jgi:vesicle-associated membrane protein 72
MSKLVGLSPVVACHAQADRFVRTGKTLRRQMWWQNCKMKLVVAFAVVLLAVVVFLLVCFSGGNCLK